MNRGGLEPESALAIVNATLTEIEKAKEEAEGKDEGPGPMYG